MAELSRPVQVHFLVDETELLFSSRYQVVTYVDKKKEKHTYPLQTILDVPNPELSKRLRLFFSVISVSRPLITEWF